MSAKTANGSGDSLKSSLAKKIIVPITATAASALASFVAKRGSAFLEQRVLPKLREATSGAGDVALGVPERVRSVADGAGDVGHEVTERARSVTGNGSSNGKSNGNEYPQLSPEELKERLQGRAEARAARRKSAST